MNLHKMMKAQDQFELWLRNAEKSLVLVTSVTLVVSKESSSLILQI